MSLVKRTDWPRGSSALADLFDNDRFFSSPWLSGRNMPAVNIKENEKTRHIPVIMFSAHPSAADRISEYGADDFLSKPVNSDLLLEKVTKQIKQTEP